MFVYRFSDNCEIGLRDQRPTFCFALTWNTKTKHWQIYLFFNKEKKEEENIQDI